MGPSFNGIVIVNGINVPVVAHPGVCAPPLTCPMEGTQQQQQEWLEVGVEVVGALAQMRLEG